MQRMQKAPFLATIYVCDRRSILWDIAIIARKLDAEKAEQKAIGKMETLCRKKGRYVGLHRLRGMYGDGNGYYSAHAADVARSTARHEAFHRKVTAAGLDEKSDFPALEESAAYAYETMAGRLGSAKEADADEHLRYIRLARHSVRFLFALDQAGQEDMLMDSIGQLSRRTRGIIAGDPPAIAMNAANDCMYYLECVAVLRRWGLREGEKILLEAVGISDREGADAGRRFLMGRLTAKTQERINASYGVDLDGFRFRSLYSPFIYKDTWEW